MDQNSHKRCLFIRQGDLAIFVTIISGANNSAERTAQRVKNDHSPILDVVDYLSQDIVPDQNIDHGDHAAADKHFIGDSLSPSGSDDHFQYAHEE